MIKKLILQGLLSYGPETPPVELGALNVLIGPNGSGKSNLIETMGLLRAAPKDISAPVKDSGGVRDWLWKGSGGGSAFIEVILDNDERPSMPIRHCFSFREHGQRFEITAEKIENQDPYPNYDEPLYYYKMEDGHPKLKDRGANEQDDVIRPLARESINPENSILSQVKDPERYPVLSYLTGLYESVYLYRDWTFGRYTPPRQPQKSDLPGKYLSESCENLALVLNGLRPKVKHEILSSLNALYPGIDDFNVQIEGGWVQLFLEEGRNSIPATRLSDGTLRYLCLLSVLCHPDPPPLVCIDEPELGLHPDILPTLADLLKAASERTQLIITTHSDVLVDAMTEQPDAVLVCEKEKTGTSIRRLDANQLRPWLEKYRLGELWTRGDIGGTRW
jgi:predicted ATPase